MRWFRKSALACALVGMLLFPMALAPQTGIERGSPGNVSAYLITPGTATGVSVVDSGTFREVVTKVTVAFGAFACNATTCDVTIATLPAKTKLIGIVADLTQAFVCAQTCTTATLSFTVGKTAGGNEYVLSADADAAAATFGLTAAQTGASLVASAAQAGDIPSWTATTTLQIRFTSAVGNIATAGVTNLNAGSITFYIVTLVLT